MAGDFNVIPTDADCYDPKAWVERRAVPAGDQGGLAPASKPWIYRCFSCLPQREATPSPSGTTSPGPGNGTRAFALIIFCCRRRPQTGWSRLPSTSGPGLGRNRPTTYQFGVIWHLMHNRLEKIPPKCSRLSSLQRLLSRDNAKDRSAALPQIPMEGDVMKAYVPLTLALFSALLLASCNKAAGETPAPAPAEATPAPAPAPVETPAPADTAPAPMDTAPAPMDTAPGADGRFRGSGSDGRHGPGSEPVIRLCPVG